MTPPPTIELPFHRSTMGVLLMHQETQTKRAQKEARAGEFESIWLCIRTSSIPRPRDPPRNLSKLVKRNSWWVGALSWNPHSSKLARPSLRSLNFLIGNGVTPLATKSSKLVHKTPCCCHGDTNHGAPQTDLEERKTCCCVYTSCWYILLG